MAAAHPGPGVPREDLARLEAGTLADPQRVLGPHAASDRGRAGTIVRAWRPDAVGAECLPADGEPLPMRRVHGALFAVFLPTHPAPRYRLRFRFGDGNAVEVEDPYRFPEVVGEIDRHLIGEGTHRRLWTALGAHPRTIDGVEGVAFSVWAPNAQRVSVVGEFCGWDGRLLPMRNSGAPGLFELFVPGPGPGALYKFEIKAPDGSLRLKTDPLAFAMEHPPGTAAIVHASTHRWQDSAWMEARARRDPLREPMAIYEVHPASWMWDGGRRLRYDELADRLVEHLLRFGFTHLELTPVCEHPFDGSWGYQVSGYYAPTARFGTPDDLRRLVDRCHAAGIGVILDWVPAHFPRDDFALRRFDGTALYEHEDPRLGEHPDWGTLIFNYGRLEVRNFLISNALYWLEEFHVDGLRVDAVASILYRDYSRREGQWLPNRHGGRENLEGIEFLQRLNQAVREEQPGCVMIAEESTAWSGVTRPVEEGGLGFALKWNMGWMHDTLEYMARDPIHRTYHHDEFTFAALYEHTEHFLMPLSHDEVVHGKRSLLEKMPGDAWQKLANLRLLLAYQYTRPGKKLLFMGTELAPYEEWDHTRPLDWGLAGDPARAGLARLLEALGRMYREHPCLWRSDPEPKGFAWIDCSDRHNSVFAYVRRWEDDELITVVNATPVPREDYRIGAPRGGAWIERLDTDAVEFGGSGYPTRGTVVADPTPWHGYALSLRLSLPPLAVLVLTPQP